MSRLSTAAKEWQQLITMVGGVSSLCDSLGISQTTFHRISHGQRPFPADKVQALEILCELYDVPNPLDKLPKPRVKDLTPLRLLGEALERGFPVTPKMIEKVRVGFPTEQLVELAESDGTPPVIMRAIAAVLET